MGLRLSVAQAFREHYPFLGAHGYQRCRAITILTSWDYIKVSHARQKHQPYPENHPGWNRNAALAGSGSVEAHLT